tara:strand:- start:810 stop:986 length:177 start_codon:yes stop_codon:yes gene_type:complete
VCPEVAAGASAYIAGIESQRAITQALQEDHVSDEAAIKRQHTLEPAPVVQSAALRLQQ